MASHHRSTIQTKGAELQTTHARRLTPGAFKRKNKKKNNGMSIIKLKRFQTIMSLVWRPLEKDIKDPPILIWAQIIHKALCTNNFEVRASQVTTATHLSQGMLIFASPLWAILLNGDLKFSKLEAFL